MAQQMSSMDLNSSQPRRLDVSARNLRMVADLGAGNGGTVSKVEHLPTGIMMAKKVVFIDAKPDIRKQILRAVSYTHLTLPTKA